MLFTKKVEVVNRGSGNGGSEQRKWGSFREKVGIVVVKGKLVVVVVNGESGCHLWRK